MTEGRDEGWERQVLERLALEPWRSSGGGGAGACSSGCTTLACVAAALWIFGGFGEVEQLEGRHTALISLEGEIAAKGEVSADHVVASLQAAFADKTPRASCCASTARRQPGAGGHHQRRDRAPARAAPRGAGVRGGGGYLRLGRLLRGGGGRPDLRGQGEHRRFDRRADGRLRLCRADGAAGHRAPPADRRRQQGLPRSLLAPAAQAAGARQTDAPGDPRPVRRHRCAKGSRRAAQRTPRCSPG